ncbi:MULTISPECIES: hypothetical protein [Pseudomonas]|nr:MULTISPECIES: hypothetical protein [Pseudomonas]
MANDAHHILQSFVVLATQGSLLPTRFPAQSLCHLIKCFKRRLLDEVSALEKGLNDEQALELLSSELRKIDALGATDCIGGHYQDGKVICVRPNRQIDPQKLEAKR